MMKRKAAIARRVAEKTFTCQGCGKKVTAMEKHTYEDCVVYLSTQRTRSIHGEVREARWNTDIS